MTVDETRRAVQEIANMADKTYLEAHSNYGKDISGDALLVSAMLKYLVAMLGIIATAISEKK